MLIFKTPLQPPAGEVGSVQALLVSGRGSNNLGMNLPLLCFGCLTLPFLSWGFCLPLGDQECFRSSAGERSLSLAWNQRSEAWKWTLIKTKGLLIPFSSHLCIKSLACYHQKVYKQCMLKTLWQCGEKGTLLHRSWECELMQLLWRPVWRSLKNRNTELPYDPAIPLLGTYPEKMKTNSKRSMHPYIQISAVNNS